MLPHVLQRADCPDRSVMLGFVVLCRSMTAVMYVEKYG